MFKKTLFIFSILISLFLTVNSATAQPAAIGDLSCRPDISEGAVWLSWTVPFGIAGSDAYDARYVQGNTINFDTATVFSQNWLSGSVGEPKQELITGLAPGTQFSFAVKSKDASGNWSAVSNQATCYAPKSTSRETIPPQSIIINPGYQTTIAAGKSYMINGRALDRGGSSVQKVEVSLDDGKTWLPAKIKDVIDINYLWEFVWQNPVVGQYKIKSRATDWLNNVETAGLAIPVEVVTELAGEKEPIQEATIEELKTKIAALQTKIIELLTQLIALYQKQINQILAK